MKSTVKRILSLMIAVLMVAASIPMGTLDVLAAEKTNAVVIAGSDFQPKPELGPEGGQAVVKNILNTIKKDYPVADGFLFEGDLRYSLSDPDPTGINNGHMLVQEAVSSVYPNMPVENMEWAQGNHDTQGVQPIQPTGAYDTPDYGVFVINIVDYQWNGAALNKAHVERTAAKLKAYYDEKIAQHYQKPIFVITHVPLHYSMRTKINGDAAHANLLFNVINDAGAQGINTIFLYGHNHSHGWDNYLGGAAVYLAKGDKINIAQGSQTVFREETLNFTYINGGYMGYYDGYQSMGGHECDNALTMTVFEIKDSHVKVTRYDQNGTHNLKSEGFHGSEHPTTDFAENKTIYPSPQRIYLGTVELIPDPEPPKTATGGVITQEGSTVSKPSTTPAKKLTDGTKYLITSKSDGRTLTSGKVSGENMIILGDNKDDYVTVKDNGGGKYTLTFDKTNKVLHVFGSHSWFSSNYGVNFDQGGPVNVEYSNTGWKIYTTHTTTGWGSATYYYYLTNNGTNAAVRENGNVGDADLWNFYPVETTTTPGGDLPVEFTVSDGSIYLFNGDSGSFTPEVKVDGAVTQNYQIEWTSAEPSIASVDTNGRVTGNIDGNTTVRATLTHANGKALKTPIFVDLPVTVKTPEAPKPIYDYVRVTDIADISEGNYLLIKNDTQQSFVTPALNNTGLTSVDTAVAGPDQIEGTFGDYEWVLTNTASGVKLGTVDGKYLKLAAKPALNTKGDTFKVTGTADNFKIKTADGAFTFGKASDGSYIGKASDGSVYYLYQKLEPEKPVEFSITPTSVNIKPGEATGLQAVINYGGEPAKSYELTYTSANPDIAMASDGTVLGFKDGSTTVTALLTKVNGRKLAHPRVITIPVSVSANGSGNAGNKEYTRITNLNQFTDGQYLIFLNSPENFMVPEVVTINSRQGFNLESTTIAGPDKINGDYTAKEWTLKKDGSSWKIGTADGNITLTDTGKNKLKVTATLTSPGEKMNITGTADNFEIHKNGTKYVLNYNERGLINGYNGNPAKFFFYKAGAGENTANKTISGIALDGGRGKVNQFSPADVKTGTNIIVSFDDGSTMNVPVTVEMLSGGGFDINTNGAYENVTVSFGGQQISGYGIDVIKVQEPEKPVEFTVEPSGVVLEAGKTAVLTPHVTYGGAITDTYEIVYESTNPEVAIASDGTVIGLKGGNTTVTATLTSVNGRALSSPRTVSIPVTVNMAAGEKQYRRVTDVSQITDGDRYLLIYNDSTDKFMRPVVVEKANSGGSKRRGFDVEDTTIAGPDIIKGDYAAKEWIFKKSGSNWHIGTTDGYITFNEPGGVGIAAELSSNGNNIKIGGTANNFTFSDASGSPVLNYNSRGLINGFKDNPAKFYIYKLEQSEVVPERQITGIELEGALGSVKKNSAPNIKTGTSIIVSFSDGTTAKVPVTVGMVSGAGLDVKNPGVYENLTVSFGGKTVGGYTLEVKDIIQTEYPEFPDEGAVRVDKTGEGLDFQASGIAKVELSATGVPLKKGVDVLVMLDTSSSMKDNTVTGTTKTRLQVMKESLSAMVNMFKQPNADGSSQDIRMAIADFNGYFPASSSPFYLDSTDHLRNDTVRTNKSAAKIYTGDKTISAGAFQTAQTITDATINGITAASGTNYDYAFAASYQMINALQQQNAAAGIDRQLIVVFMSDGAPFQYNYFSAFSSNAGWNDWLQGTYPDAASVNTDSVHKHYYNGPGNLHRTAEAIKGSPDNLYDVIVKNDPRDTDGDNIIQVPGLGAQMYSIGFALAVDNQITVESMTHVLENISSDPTTMYRAVESADELTDAFTDIGRDIQYAATNARFIDTMGPAYDIQLATSHYQVKQNGKLVDRTITPEIIITDYETYTRADVDAGRATLDQIGTRTGKSVQLEKVTFNAAGTEAYSDKLPGQNILVNGIITAKHFIYNTTDTAVMVDLDGDGVKEYSLESETFYWTLGTVKQTETTMSYYVYLTGSMEGTRPAGSYPTNESAILYYNNWLDHPAQLPTVSPVLPWGEANVSYAFYLVNTEGEVIVNRNGTTGSFPNRINVTNPVVYSQVKLNAQETISDKIVSQNVLPAGYELYDPDASYEVGINSNSTGFWNITKGADKVPTTVVTQYKGSEHSREQNVTNISYDYTHTVVWFAVLYTVKAVEDSVVVDFGLPVDINVMANDMFMDSGELKFVGPYTEGDATGSKTPAFTTESYMGTYGTAETAAPAGSNIKEHVRYTLSSANGMQMKEPEVFSYAVNYTGTYNPGYYYGKVTVIPAANIYYEETFITFNDSSAAHDGIGNWTEDGVRDTEAHQDEDRPGLQNIAGTDANNIYGFDSAYKTYNTFSNGASMKVTVDAVSGKKNTAPTAKFTFTGTGFDVISLTDVDSGLIIVSAVNRATHEETRQNVNNYYNYTYGDYTDKNGNPMHGWHVTDDNKLSSEKVWQVPVVKFADLPYGTYDVTIQVAYLKMMDIAKDGQYSFWMDAIRTYDPAQGNKTSEDAYKQDSEFDAHFITLRNLIVEAARVNGEIAEGAVVNGTVFIDGQDSVTSVKDYENPGPNNETYIAYAQGISFKLKSNKIPDKVQIGVKIAFGDKATLKLNKKDFRAIDTATDLYYDISDKIIWRQNGADGYISDVITLSNYTERTVLSVTNVKYIGTDVALSAEIPEVQPMMMRAFAAPMAEEPINLSVVVDKEAVDTGMRVMSLLYAPRPVETTTEETTAEETTAEQTTAEQTTAEETTTEQTTVPEIQTEGTTAPETTTEEQTTDDKIFDDSYGPIGSFINTLVHLINVVRDFFRMIGRMLG